MEQNNPKTDMELEAMYNMATKFMNYTGPKTRKAMSEFAGSSPAIAAKMGQYQQTMKQMSQPVQMNQGGSAPGYYTDFVPAFGRTVMDTMSPVRSDVSQLRAANNQFIGSRVGQIGGGYGYTASTAGAASQARAPRAFTPSTYGSYQVGRQANRFLNQMDPYEYRMQVSQDALVDPAQMDKSSVSNVQAAQGEAYFMNNPVQRELEQGELVQPVANAQKAAKFTEQIEAATATPSEQATVKGQLEGLMQDFEGGDTPAWAAGAMRAAMGTLSARGLGASSIAGQAVVQAAMESALPIASADAATVARFESQNLSNKQQRAMLAAQQRAQFMGMEFDQKFQARVMNASKVSDIANMNFTAEQQVALENARAANTMNMANLSNSQAVVMAEAAALAQMDMANLSNRQQAAVQNAQAFLETDFRNMDRAQQTAIFKAQQKMAALFSDQAAENAERQFNATSKNQVKQYFAGLQAQTSQFNASQKNAMKQFNTNAKNASKQFNADMRNQRQQFNAKNSLVIAQANAQWRQNIATLNTAAQNEANMEYAKSVNSLTASNLDAIWQRERDLMSYNFTSEESAKDRALKILMSDKEMEALKEQLGYAENVAQTKLAFKFLFGTAFKGIFG